MKKLALIEGWNETSKPGVSILIEGGAPKRVSVSGEAFMVWLPGRGEAEFDSKACDEFLATYGARVQSHDLWGGGGGGEDSDESVCELEAVDA